MKRYFSIPLIAALVIWLVCLAVGFELSQRRMLWNDEIYTQTRSIDQMSYAAILQGRIPEGNNCPLFYVLQKSVGDVLHYQYPVPWEGEWFVSEPRSQVILRILPNVLMSTAIALIFYFFARYYTLGAGVFALAAVLASPMVWMYWLESRPYALWFFLTAVQSLLFLRIPDGSKQPSKGWQWLALVHLALASTISLGAAQVVVASILFWVFKDRRWKHYVFLTVIPLFVTVFYYVHAPQFKYWFREGLWELICQNVPLEYFIIFLLYGAVVFCSVAFNKSYPRDGESGQYFLFAGLMALIAVALLGFLKLKATDGSVGFAISSRYFIFLIPVAVVTATLCLWDLWRVFKDGVWMRANVLIVVLGLLVLRAFKTYIAVMASGTFMHLIR